MTTTNTPTPATLDFARIRQECPKAFAAMEQWATENHKVAQREQAIQDEFGRWSYHRELTNPRDLFDFFDAQGVLVYPYPITATCWESYVDSNGTVICAGDFPTRPEAETAGFIRAFTLLEERL